MSQPLSPAQKQACAFIKEHYAELGDMAPAQFSREEQHAITVLSAYIESQGTMTPETADVLASWAEAFSLDQVRLMDLAVGMTLATLEENQVTIRSADIAELIENFEITRDTLPGNAGWTVKLVRRQHPDQGKLDLEG